MSLPKIETSVFPLTLPVSKKSIKFKAFTVKEQRILLEATADGVEMTTLEEVLKNCTMGTVDISSLPIVDIEYLFLHVRGKSVGEVIDLAFICETEVDDENQQKKRCGNRVEAKVNIRDIKVDRQDFETKVVLEDDFILDMQPPTMTDANAMMKQDITEDEVYELMLACVKTIHYQDNVYNTAEYSKTDLKSFFDDLTTGHVEKIKAFFEQLPTMKHDLTLECRSCGTKEEIHLEGLAAFLA